MAESKKMEKGIMDLIFEKLPEKWQVPAGIFVIFLSIVNAIVQTIVWIGGLENGIRLIKNLF